MPGQPIAPAALGARRGGREQPRGGLARTVLLGVLVAALALLIGRTELFRAFELRTVDWRFHLRGTRGVESPVAVVFIDDAAIDALGRWPWSWDHHALLVDVLHRAGARLVLFDVLFAEAPGPTDERLFAAAVRGAGNVQLISAFPGLSAPDPGDPASLARGTAVTEPLPSLRAAAAGVGHANAVPDRDGTTRRVPLLVRRGRDYYPSLALRAALPVLGVPWPEGVRPAAGGAAIELLPRGGPPRRIPVGPDGATPLAFPGGVEAFPLRYSYLQVLQADSYPERAAVDLGQLRGKVVLVGATFTGNTDLRPTPFSPTYPMLLVQATAIDNILRGEFVRFPPARLSALLALVLGALVGAAAYLVRPLASLAITAAVGAGYATAGVAAFSRGLWQLELVPPLLATLAAYVVVTTARYVETRRERQRAVERLTYLGHLVESAREAIFSFGPDGLLASWNAAAARLFGWSEGEVLGRGWAAVLPGEVGGPVREALARLAAGGSPGPFEARVERRDGREIPVEISLSAIRDTSGRTVGTSALAVDLTEKKRMIDLLVQSEKLAEIGRMGSGIVHEIKNPLTSIMMMSDIIVATPGLPEKTLRYADIIQKESQRILRLSQNILSFARPQRPEMRATDLGRVVADTLALTEYELKKAKVKVREELDADAPPVWGDGEKLKQVLLNLVVNAAHAMEGGGALEVRTRGPGRGPGPAPGGGEERARAVVGEAPEGAAVSVEVADHGAGIAGELLERIFEPFFSTKGEGKGTGLGLYISRNIVLEHGGRIEVASAPGAGTTFTITLPAAPARGAAAGEARGGAAAAPAGAG